MKRRCRVCELQGRPKVVLEIEHPSANLCTQHPPASLFPIAVALLKGMWSHATSKPSHSAHPGLDCLVHFSMASSLLVPRELLGCGSHFRLTEHRSHTTPTHHPCYSRIQPVSIILPTLCFCSSLTKAVPCLTALPKAFSESEFSLNTESQPQTSPLL